MPNSQPREQSPRRPVPPSQWCPPPGFELTPEEQACLDDLFPAWPPMPPAAQPGRES